VEIIQVSVISPESLFQPQTRKKERKKPTISGELHFNLIGIPTSHPTFTREELKILETHFCPKTKLKTSIQSMAKDFS
jgi:hypothetical protein